MAIGVLLAAQAAQAARLDGAPLVVGLLAEFPPFQVWPDGGDPSGVDVRVLDHLHTRVGLRYGLRRFDNFSSLRAALEDGSIDLAMASARNAERERTLIFSEPYAQVRQALVARADEAAATLAPDLAGRRLGVSRGEVSEMRARELFPGARVELVDSLPLALQALAEGRVDYVLDALPAVRRVVESRRVKGLRVLETYARPEGGLRLAMRRGQEAVLAELQRGLASLPPRDMLNWQREAAAAANYLQVAGEFHASEAERALLRSSGWRVAYLADDRPFSYADANGQPAGLNIDLLRALQERLGFSIDTLRSMTPAEAMRAAEAGQLDLLLGLTETAARRQYLSFVGPYRREPLVIVSRRGSGLSALAHLAGGRLALPVRHWARVLIEARYPNIELVACSSDADCAEQVRRGQALATLAQLSRRSAGGSRDEPRGLAVTGVLDELRAEEFVALGGARRDQAPLVRRALEDVMLNDLPSFDRKWLRTPAPQTGIDPETVRLWGGAALALLLVVLAAWLLHTRALRRVIAQREAARAEAEAAMQVRARYLSFMAHEVRNTLGGISGAAGLLQQPGNAELAARLLPALRQSADGTLQLLNDLLDQGRIDAGHLRLLPAATDMAALVRDVVAELQPAAAAKGLHLSFGGPVGGAVCHELDALRVSQIVRNLVANAVKYTLAGDVTVRLGRVPAGDAADELLLSVRDTGVGIAREDQPRLFLPYGQVGRQSAGGTGLGLALCSQLAQLMGGEIELDSTPGTGSTFSFRMRARRSAPPPAAAPQAAIGGVRLPTPPPALPG